MISEACSRFTSPPFRVLRSSTGVCWIPRSLRQERDGARQESSELRFRATNGQVEMCSHGIHGTGIFTCTNIYLPT